MRHSTGRTFLGDWDLHFGGGPVFIYLNDKMGFGEHVTVNGSSGRRNAAG